MAIIMPLLAVSSAASAGVNPISTSYDLNFVWHGFVRAADGTITTIDIPGAGTGGDQGTLVNTINAAGTVAGLYVDPNNVNHGFVRAADGTITTFDAPGAGTGFFQGTDAVSIDAAGTNRRTQSQREQFLLRLHPRRQRRDILLRGPGRRYRFRPGHPRREHQQFGSDRPATTTTQEVSSTASC
jgi:hypothetical protein